MVKKPLHDSHDKAQIFTYTYEVIYAMKPNMLYNHRTS